MSAGTSVTRRVPRWWPAHPLGQPFMRSGQPLGRTYSFDEESLLPIVDKAELIMRAQWHARSRVHSDFLEPKASFLRRRNFLLC